MEQEDHLDDPQDAPLVVHLDDHLDDPQDDLPDDPLEPLDDQLVDPLGAVEEGRADQDQVQAPDLRTLHCSSCCEPVPVRFLIKTF